jgi:hypothetical protein
MPVEVTISIVIPCYNYGRYVGQAIMSGFDDNCNSSRLD